MRVVVLLFLIRQDATLPRMGAQTGPIATNNPAFNPRDYDVDLYVPAGGLLRKRVPRPNQLTQHIEDQGPAR